MSDDTIDLSVFTELQDAAGADFIEELVSTFLEETPGILSELKTAAQSNDQDQFRRAAHSIKSNASTFGAVQLAELAREMELGGLREEMDTNETQIAALDVAFQSAASALKSIING
ncbi:MAG: histidine kinase [Rhizobiaceae bacterium]|nr:histidine kinase [Rhizobiaceae bacterium]